MRCHPFGIILLTITLTVYATATIAFAKVPKRQEDIFNTKTNIVFIFDSSGSMRNDLHGVPRIQAARQLLEKSLDALPANSREALWVFGHRKQKDCTDIEEMVPIGTGNREDILQKAQKLSPMGTTPLGKVLSKAAKKLKKADGAKVMVLITDGADECRADPCKVARDIARSGIVIRVNTIGIHANNLAKKQLQCIAREGGGRYFQVSDKRSLYKAISGIQEQIKKDMTPESLAGGRVNLLSPQKGGAVISSGYTNWNRSISGKAGESTWAWPGQTVVFAFKNNGMARFHEFQLEIPNTLAQNVKEFELMASDGGPYYSLGVFETQNTRKKGSLYQKFTFEETDARFFKFKVISNYGQQMQGYGNTQIFQIKLMGELL